MQNWLNSLGPPGCTLLHSTTHRVQVAPRSFASPAAANDSFTPMRSASGPTGAVTADAGDCTWGCAGCCAGWGCWGGCGCCGGCGCDGWGCWGCGGGTAVGGA